MSGIVQVADKAILRQQIRAWQAAGERIAFVPTMGYLHAGHVALMTAARALADRLVLSIFVNPTQFGPTEDLSRYPRDLDGDLGKASGAGVDLVFLPTNEMMYPPGYQTFVDVRQVSQGLCGATRPGHFLGVATIVCKLFNLVEPDVALFGAKDFQQLQVIRRMVKDLDLDVEVRSLPTVREADGLAMSSRNSYLSADERQTALALSRALTAARAAFADGERNGPRLEAIGRAELEATPGVRVDYLELRDVEFLQRVTAEVTKPVVMAVAAFVGKTRLIDNAVFE